MNNEDLKSAIFEIKCALTHETSFSALACIEDYITNLQESEAYYYGQYKDYKSRNEKAIEYIKSYNIDFENTKFGEAPLNINDLQKLLNILQGEDKDE